MGLIQGAREAHGEDRAPDGGRGLGEQMEAQPEAEAAHALVFGLGSEGLADPVAGAAPLRLRVVRECEVVHRGDELAVEADGLACGGDALVDLSQMEEGNAELVKVRRVLRCALGEGVEERGGLGEELGVEQAVAQGFSIIGRPGEGFGFPACELLSEQVACAFGVVGGDDRRVACGAGVEQEGGDSSSDAGVARVEAEHDVEVLDRKGVLTGVLGELGEGEMGVGVVGLDLEDAPEFFLRFGRSVHVAQEFAKVEERVDIPRVLAEFEEVELASALVAAGGGEGLGETGLHTGEGGVETGGLAEAPDGALVLAAVHERVGHGGVDVGVLGIDLLGEIKDEFGLVVLVQPTVGLDTVNEGIEGLGVELGGLFKEGDGVGGAVEAEEVHADHQRGLRVVGVELEGFFEGVDGVVVAHRGFEGEPKVEVPLTLVGVEGDGLTELRFGFLPAARFVELVSSFDVFLGIEPVVHGFSPRVSAEGAGRGKARGAAESGNEW